MKIFDMITSPLAISLEEDASGKTVVEKELVLYCNVQDPIILKQADSVEYQEQWEIKLPKTEETAVQGRMRVRKIIKDGITQFIYTVKIKVSEGELETSTEVTEDLFKQFKMLASSGMVKNRYTYAIAGSDMKWELDVPVMKEDKPNVWCKLDLEYKGDKPNPLPKVPIGIKVIVDKDKENYTPQEKEFVHKLYQDVFLRKNEYVEKDN